MNKKVLFAVALPLFLSACNNELENVASVEQTNSTEIVGAKLVGNGLTIEVNRGDVESRLSGGVWEKGDQLGLAWFRSNKASSIFAEQVLAGLTWSDYNGVASNKRDHKIYGNHKFSYDGSNWATESNVYEGFHFAYYPYAYMKQVDQIVISPNAESQKADFNYEANNNTFWISAQDTVLATAVTEEGTVSKKIDMVRAVNVLKFNIASNAPFSSANALKDLNITGLEIQTGGAGNMFYTTAQVNPSYLPYAVYEDVNENGIIEADEYNSKKTTDKINASIYTTGNTAFKLSGEVPSLKTSIDATANITLGEPQSVRMFLLPTKEVSLVEGGIAIYVYVPGGYFRIDSTEGTAKNIDALNKLRALLSAEGFDGNKLSALKYGNYGIDIELVKADFTPDFSSISNIDEWNGAVAIANALEMINPTFIVDGEVCITNNPEKEFQVPANGVTINTVGEGKICIENDYTIPATIAAGLSETDAVVVKTGATLSIEDNVTLNAAITNNGIIEVGYKAVAKPVDNKGRINVIYGSYVEVKNPSAPGVIAYNVTGNDKAYQINYLTAEANILGNAHVNTLVVGNGIEFDLSMVDHDDIFEDPYNGSVVSGKTLERMNEMKFELNDGTIVADANSGVNVKNVEVVGGENNEIWNINIDENLTITEGKVTVDAACVGTYKESLKVKGTIDNKSELVANVDIYTKNVSNPAGAKTTVNTDYTIWYTTTYTQGGTASGNITKIESLPGIFTTVTATYDPGKTDVQNGKNLFDFISTQPNGVTVVLPKNVTYELTDGETSRFTDKSFTLVGQEGTVIKGQKYGLVLDATTSQGQVVNLKNLTVTTSHDWGHAIYAKNYVTVNLQNVKCVNNGNVAILLDSSNKIGGIYHSGVTTKVNAYNVTVDNGDIVELNANPCTSTTKTVVTYAQFNFEGGNINVCQPQNVTRSTGDNLFVNGVALPAYTE